MKLITRTVEVTPTPIELGALFGASNDYDQADSLAAAVDEMSSGGKDFFASETQALYLAHRIPADSRTAQWLRALVGFIDGTAAREPPQSKETTP
jgi:ethanolamine utilization microcompartment shell protein EutL